MTLTHETSPRPARPVYRLSRRSLAKLEGVHADLVAVVKRAIEITDVDFGVTCGPRTVGRQRHLVKIGASSTMNSRHLTGHAVDLVAYDGRRISWDWPLYRVIARAMNTAARELQIHTEWGGNWQANPDGPHFQLAWGSYPLHSPDDGKTAVV